MKMNKNIAILAVLLFLLPGVGFSQEFSVSPYSIFGIGDIQVSDGGRLSGMGGAGVSLRGGRFVNTNNPASLTSIDSTTFLFDVAASGKGSRFTSGGVAQKSFNANFTKVSAGTRLTRWWSMGAFVQPYSNVSYKIDANTSIEGTTATTITKYFGDGGISRFTVSNGFALTRHLSLGVNTTFLFGGIEKKAELDDYTIKETAKSKKIIADFGLQYYTNLGDYELSVGLVGGYPYVLDFKNRRQILDNNLNEVEEYKRYDTQFTIPEFYGGGVSLSKGSGLIFAADYRFQKWSKTTDFNTGRSFRDTHKVSAGFAFIPNEQYASSYFEIIQYQLGASVSNSYLNLKGTNPINYEVSAGIGFPFKGGSLMNIVLAYGKKGTTDYNLIREDYFRVILNFSISERWFAKNLYD